MSLDGLIATEAARDAVIAALGLPAPLGKLILQYIGMFRPPKRQLSWDRVAALFSELALPMAHGKIERKGRAWSAPLEYWRAALEEILAKRDTLRLPLKSHGYLYEIIVGYAGKTEAAQEALREPSRAHGHQEQRWGAGAIDKVLERQIPEHVKEQLERIGAKFKKDGDGDQG